MIAMTSMLNFDLVNPNMPPLPRFICFIAYAYKPVPGTSASAWVVGMDAKIRCDSALLLVLVQSAISESLWQRVGLLNA
jgi:hypothetical protein